MKTREAIHCLFLVKKEFYLKITLQKIIQFSTMEKNDYSKQIINEVLNEILELDNKKMREMMNGEHQKKYIKKGRTYQKEKTIQTT